MSGEVLERSAALQYPVQEPNRAHLEVHVDGELGWRHSHASEHFWSDLYQELVT